MGRGWGRTEPQRDEHRLKLIYPDWVQSQQPFRLKENRGTPRLQAAAMSPLTRSFQLGKWRQRETALSPEWGPGPRSQPSPHLPSVTFLRAQGWLHYTIAGCVKVEPWDSAPPKAKQRDRSRRDPGSVAHPQLPCSEASRWQDLSLQRPPYALSQGVLTRRSVSKHSYHGPCAHQQASSCLRLVVPSSRKREEH